MRPLPTLIKHVGRGARLAKDLDRDEAQAVMRAIAAGEADAYQTGAFLIAMRMKSESADELAGFVLALREQAAGVPEMPGAIDVDLHADGREGRPQLALAAACIAAASGARVLVRGWFGNAFARNDVGEALALLGVDPARGMAAARRGMEVGVAVLDLESYAPRIAELLALRERLGVRTCIHSAVKLLDPAATRRPVVGIFHSPYHAPVAGAARALGAERALVVQAAGGVPEISPDKPTRVSWVTGGVVIGPETTGGAPEPPVGRLDAAETAADLAALIEAVLAGHGPAGATRSAVLTAAAFLWVAGRGTAIDDPEVVSEAYDALRDGAAARARGSQAVL